jgi:hypothetical protein
MYVHSTSAFICDPAHSNDHLKEDLKKYTDYFFRRVNRFILLSLTGVHRCVHLCNIGNSTAIYLATENGNLGDTENVLHQLYKENSFPKPFNFINTMSNTAAFYVAQSLKTLGRNITVSSKNASFERGLELARIDFMQNHITEALVGGVDEAVFSREHFIGKYEEQYHEVRLVDGSSWLYLTSRKEGALGEITDIKTFHTCDDAVLWAKSLPLTDPLVLSFGILATAEDKDTWKREFPHDGELEYIGSYGFYDTMASFAASTFFQNFTARSFIHINRNVQGKYILLACKRY